MATYIPEVKPDTSAYGDTLVSELKPYVTVKATYGLLDEVSSFTLNNGTTSSVSEEFTCQTGTTSGGYASILSKQPIVYVPGVGAEARVTARFSTPVSNSIQGAGFFNATDGMFFGYMNTGFAVVHRHHGLVGVYTLTITTPSSTSVSCTITLAGVNYSVPVTSGTAQSNAHEIATGLVGLPGINDVWFIQHVDNTVIFTAKTDGLKSGTYSCIPASGALVGNISVNSAGLAATEDVFLQSEWNVDTCSWLDPTKGNIYKFEYGYLGYGILKFSVFNPTTRRFVLCHVVNWTNGKTKPNFGNPSFRVGWVAGSRGSTTNLVVKGASAMAGLQGNGSRTRSFGTFGVVSGVGTETQVLTLQSRREFGNRANLGVIIPKVLTVATDSGKGAVFKLYLNPNVGGTTVHQYVNKDQSIATYDTAGTTVTNGRILGSYSVGPSGRAVIDLGLINNLLAPGDQFVVSAGITSGSVSEMSASITWDELV